VSAPESPPATDERPPPATDEQIEAYTVGTPRRLDGTVALHEYDPRWPACFVAQAEAVRAALGDTAVSVEHIGSTSVPGLAAKPVIDIVLVVPDSSDEPSYVPALEGAGFRLLIREPGWHQHRMLMKRREDGDDESVNLHVFTDGCTAPQRDVRFRDWLRGHDEDGERYEDTKRELAARVWKYMQNYADAKTAVIDDIRTRCGEPPGRCTRF
jgi:GrpB-like predicted nucleotidyltransferase (UPF0157 family)